MTTAAALHADLTRVLPAGPDWACSARHLMEVLRTTAGIAYRFPRAAFGVPALVLDTAADALIAVVEALDTENPPAPDYQLLALPAFRLAALHETRGALHRALAGDDGAEHLLDTLELLTDPNGFGILVPGLTPAGALRDLDRILAVLDLDLPAARMLAATHLAGRPHTPAARTALAQVTAAWCAIGIST
ncbi:hypothetical protein AB0O31_33105 [Kitasatospora cineracea]|uniref:hypothetical protein n=1 Tax=Kitasatospora cineracea TaxID=88074 RepID=UPI0034450B92